MKGISLFITCLLLISVVRGEDAFNCKQGEGVSDYAILISGFESQCKGDSEITRHEECAAAAKNYVHKNEGYGGLSYMTHRPPGCFYDTHWKKYYFNPNKKSDVTCDPKYNCICKRKACRKCPMNTYSKGGANALCIPCKAGEVTDSKQSKCFGVNDLFEEIKKDLTAQKEKQNDLSIKNSRLWQKEQIRMQHDELLAKIECCE